jgi:outer membrane protein
VEIAELEIDKAKAGHKPTLDATASYGITRNKDGSATTLTDSKPKAGTVGVAFNLPLFAGFATQNRIRETLALEDKARTDLEGTRRQVAQAVRTAYFGVRPARARCARWKRRKPPARARWTPTGWATRSACASTSTC